MNPDSQSSMQQKMLSIELQMKKIHSSLNKRKSVQLQMRFLHFLDNTLQSLYTIDDLHTDQYNQYESLKDYQQKAQKLTLEKTLINFRLKNLNEQEYKLIFERIELQNSRLKLQKDKLLEQLKNMETQKEQQVSYLKRQNNNLEQQLLKVTTMNKRLAQQNDNLKKQRNMAQQRQLQWKIKYDQSIEQKQSKLKTVDKSKPRTVEEGKKLSNLVTSGLKTMMVITHPGTNAVRRQKYVMLQLPAKFHAVKIAYGIRIGWLLSNKQVVYCKNIYIYEKDQMQLTSQNGVLVVHYLRRNDRLESQKIGKNPVIIMLFGKGDSIAIDQAVKN